MTARHGAVAAGHPLTARAAADILADDGNAFDAVLAGLFMACAAEPVMASPGAGGFLAARSGGRVSHFDFFAAAPARMRPAHEIEFEEVLADFGTATQGFHVGAGASAVPGLVPGLFAVHERLGRMPMPRIAEAAVSAAKEGVTVSAFQAFLFGVVAPIYRWTPEADAIFAAGGALPDEGGTLANPELADALEAIAREGPDIALRGEIAQAMARVAGDHGGHLTIGDIAGYRTEVREPLVCAAGRWRVHLNPPPALGGALVAAMLAVAGEDAADPCALARAIDAVDRRWREAPADPARLIGSPGPRPAGLAVRGTTHISVIDANGNAAAATVSNGEGNGRIVPGCGFMLNNMLGEEDLNPNGFHRWSPGTRLGSMMTPAIAMTPEGDAMALGSGGSNRIRTAILQVLAHRCLSGEPLDVAIAAARLHVERGHLDFEDEFPAAQRDRLAAAFADHRAWPERNLYFGGVHAVERSARGAFSGAGDPRRDGTFAAM